MFGKISGPTGPCGLISVSELGGDLPGFTPPSHIRGKHCICNVICSFYIQLNNNFRLLDEASLQFNADPVWGLNLLEKNGLIDESNATDVAFFILGTNKLYWKQVRDYVSKRFDVLTAIVALQNFQVSLIFSTQIN